MEFTTKFNIDDTAYKQGWGGRLEAVKIVAVKVSYSTCNSRGGEYGVDEMYTTKDREGKMDEYNYAEYLYKTEAQAIKVVMEKQ